MKSKQAALLLVAMVAAGVVLAQGAPTPQPTGTHAGFVKSARGSVHLAGPSGEERVARPGDRIDQVDRIVTGPDSGASVVLRDGTTLVLGPSSRLDVKEFRFDSATQDGGLLLSLIRGSLRMITGRLGKSHPEAVRVETQTATIGIRGTDFIVQADPQ